MRIFRLVCWLKTIWRTVDRSLRTLEFGYDNYICGCDFVEQENGDLKCEVCGNVSKSTYA